MPRRTKQDALITRHLILDAAEQVFQQQGVSRTSLNDIAAAAGLTRGAIYWHFQDKADLFNAMMDRVVLPLEANVCRVTDPSIERPVDAIRESFVQALRQVVVDPQMRRVFEVATHKVEYVDDMRAVRERHLASRNQCLLGVERALKRAAKAGQVRLHCSARSVAIGLHALIDGLIQNWMLDTTAFNLERVGRQVIDTYLSGLVLPASPPAEPGPVVRPVRVRTRPISA